MTTSPLINTATATDLASTGPGSSASGSDSDTRSAAVALTVTKTDGASTYTPGGTATYTVTIDNTGLSDAQNVTVTDALPAGVTLAANATCAANGTSSCGTVTGASGATSFGATLARVNAGGGNTIVFTIPVAFGVEMLTDPLVNTAQATDVPTGATASGSDSDTRSANVTLAVTKTDGSATYTPGGTAIYMVTIADTGISDALDVAVTDLLPAGVTLSGNVTCVANGLSFCGTVTGTAGQSAFGATGAHLDPGGAHTLVFTVPVVFAAGMTTDPLVNTATATDVASGNTDSGSDSDALLAAVTLAVTKTDGSATYTPGGTATYTVTVANTGLSDALDVTVTDPLPLGVTLSANATCVAGGSSSCGTVTGTTGQVAFGTTLARVNAGAGNALVFTVPVAFASNMTTSPLINTATASDISSGVTANGSDTDTRAASADLSITKTDSSTTAVPGNPVTYTIVASNAGPSVATGATVTDTLPGVLGGATWTCVGAGGGTCTASGSGNIADTVTLPVGATVTYTLTATLSVAATGTLVNTATVTAPVGVTDPVPGNNSSTDTDTITPNADLSITKTDGSTTAVPGAPITYTIVASNAGPSAGNGRDGRRYASGRADRRDLDLRRHGWWHLHRIRFRQHRRHRDPAGWSDGHLYAHGNALGGGDRNPGQYGDGDGARWR